MPATADEWIVCLLAFMATLYALQILFPPKKDKDK